MLFKSEWPIKFKAKFVAICFVNFIHIPIMVEGFNLSVSNNSVQFYDFNKSQWVDYITMICFIKLYIVYPYVKILSILNSYAGKLITKVIGMEVQDELYIKTWNKQDPLRAVTISILSLIACCGYLFHLAERKHPLDCSDASGAFSSISNCMWLVIITISTVGYGDLSTVTVLGRLISLLTAFIGLLISATLIGIV